MERVRAIAFDIGEILIRLDFDGWVRALGLGHHGGLRPAMEALGGWDAFDAFERGRLDETGFRDWVLPRLPTRMSPQEFRVAWNAVLAGPVEGVEALVRGLSARVPVFALSNTNPTHLEHILERYPWFSCFREVLASCDLGHRKPEPAIYEILIRRVGLPAGEILFVDDRAENVHGARALGITAELCSGGPGELAALIARYGARLP